MAVKVYRPKNPPPGTEIVIRKCLKCDKEFEAWGRVNRLCPFCKYLNQGICAPNYRTLLGGRKRRR